MFFYQKFKELLLVFLFVLAANVSISAQSLAEKYIQQYKTIAISEMQKYGIPASIKLAQGLLESGMGQSRLAKEANNHFGIKCHQGWTGGTIKHTDDAVDECFRVYSDPNQSYRDHSQFLVHRPRYGNLFKLKTNDYKGWARGLKAAGYATNPKYALMLIDVVERHQLYIFDMDLSPAQMEAHRNRSSEIERGKIEALQKAEVGISSNGSPALDVSPKAYVSTVFYNNNVKVIRLLRDETLKDISMRFNISMHRLREYNDITSNENLQAGDLVYLAKKKNRGREKAHLVLAHESIWSISQNYGIRLEKLLAINLLKKGEEPREGQTLSLRKKLKKKPLLRIVEKKKPQIAPAPKEEKPIAITIIEPEKDSTLQMIIQENAKKETAENIQISVDGSDKLNYRPFSFLYESATPAQSSSSTTNQILYHIVQAGETLYSLSKKYNVTMVQLQEWNNMTSPDLRLEQQIIIYR